MISRMHLWQLLEIYTFVTGTELNWMDQIYSSSIGCSYTMERILADLLSVSVSENADQHVLIRMADMAPWGRNQIPYVRCCHMRQTGILLYYYTCRSTNITKLYIKYTATPAHNYILIWTENYAHHYCCFNYFSLLIFFCVRSHFQSVVYNFSVFSKI